jgi:hypothetical protein
MNVKEIRALIRLVKILSLKEIYTDKLLLSIVYDLYDFIPEFYKDLNKIIDFLNEYKKRQKKLIETIYRILESYEEYEEIIPEPNYEDMKKTMQELLDRIDEIINGTWLKFRTFRTHHKSKVDGSDDSEKGTLIRRLSNLESFVESINETILNNTLYHDVYSDYYILRALMQNSEVYNSFKEVEEIHQPVVLSVGKMLIITINKYINEVKQIQNSKEN